jgi:ApaG protein
VSGEGASEAVTEGIRVSVRSVYVPERSAPSRNHYFFAYTVTLHNESEVAVQLVSRRWIISGPDGIVGRVEGPGVVGEQPVLAPGASYEYTSFCPLEAPFGSMEGAYQMVRGDGTRFEAQIAPFGLAVPAALN